MTPSKVLLSKINFLILPLALLTAGCAVKKRDVGTSQNPLTPTAGQATLVPGLLVGEQRKVLLRPLTSSLRTHEENTVSFQLASAELDAVVSPEYEVTVKHSMPECEGMKEPRPIDTRALAPGKYELLHETSMSDKWLFEITIKKDGALVDKVSFTLIASER